MKKIQKIILLFLIINFKSYLINPVVISAQSLDPAIWQSQATGLRTQTNSEKRTAGLSLIVKQQEWPFLLTQGGATDAQNSNLPNTVKSTFYIELGQIKTTGAGGFVSEASDWAHNRLSFNGLNLWASRLSPALVMQTQALEVTLFSGNLNGDSKIVPPQTWQASVIKRTPSPSFPKYIAYPEGNTVRVAALSSNSLNLTSAPPWILVWYGTNSHFVDTKRPLSYGGIPQADAYLSDIPLLLTFQTPPMSIFTPTEGGIRVSFANAAGYVSVLPLFGRDILKASDTETWNQALPSTVINKITWWTNRLCQFPETVTESYGYNQSTDTATITNTVSFLPVCSHTTTRFTPIPPFIAIAKDSLPLNFSQPLSQSGLMTEFGPYIGTDNQATISWNLSGLKRYTDSRLLAGTHPVPNELLQALTDHINDTVSAGHLAPWAFTDNIPIGDYRGDLYWANPADGLYHLTESVSALPVGTTSALLTNYLKSERQNYPPEDNFDLKVTEGTIRQAYSYVPHGNWQYGWYTTRTDVHQTKVPLFNFYSLARYYDLTGDPLPVNLLTKGVTALNQNMAEQDWATGYWFNGFNDRRVAVINSQRHVAGLIGLIRLAHAGNQSPVEQLSRSLLAKATVNRIFMAKYPRYLYSGNLTTLPSDPQWMAKSLAGEWLTPLINYNWPGPEGDHRQMVYLTQFRTILNDSNNFWTGTPFAGQEWNQDISSPYLVTFRDLVPETARLLSDYAKTDVMIYLNRATALNPHWYSAFSEGVLGAEHNLTHPVDSFQLVMAKAWIEQDSPPNLARFVSIPWLEFGDLFYVQKLAETIKAYRGWCWSQDGTTCDSGTLPTPPPPTPTPTYDFDHDGNLDFIDLKLLFTRPFTIFDFNHLINLF